MPGQVRDGPQTDHFESGKPCKLIEIRLRDERHDGRSLPQAKSIGKPKQPRKIRVVERDDDAAAPAYVGPHGLEQTLNVGRVIEISVEQDDVDGVGTGRDLRKIRRCC